MLTRRCRAARRSTLYAGTLALLGLAGQTDAQELIFAPVQDARRLLSSKDEFVERLSPFDRAARMKTDREVAEAEFIQFASAAALDWEDDEAGAIAAAYREIEEQLAQLRLPLPREIVFIKTSGQEEGNAVYTRGNAIIFPRRLLSSPAPTLQRLIAHELFHVASRASPRLAKSLYGAIGFDYCGEAQYPESVARRKITNPDAPREDYCIALMLDGAEVLATPILFSRSATYDRNLGGEFFEYLQLALLLREAPEAPSANEPARPASGRVVRIDEVSGFYEQVGRNTEYIIHAEEILADNFALLVMKTQTVPSPEVLERVRRALVELDGAAR